MIVEGMKVEKAEKISMDSFLPDSPAAVLLGKILLKIEGEALSELKNPVATLENLRFNQGILAGLGSFHKLTRMVLMRDWIDGEDEELGEDQEEVTDVDF